MLGLRERKKARTKAEIQRQALRLFGEQGYAETTVDQIAAAAEVSPSTFFRYFPTKDDVVLADLFDADTFDLMIEAPADLTPLQALRHAMEQTFGKASQQDLDLELVRNRLIQSVPELRRGMLAEMIRPIELLTRAVARRTGRSSDDPDVRMYAGGIVGVMMAMTAESMYEEPEDLSKVLRQLFAAADRIDRVVRLPDA